jgi:hypothetical protein
MTVVKWGSLPLFLGLWLLAGMGWWQALIAAVVFAFAGGYVAGRAGA